MAQATKFIYFIIDEDQDVTGSNNPEAVEAAAEAGFVTLDFSDPKVPLCNGDHIKEDTAWAEVAEEALSDNDSSDDGED